MLDRTASVFVQQQSHSMRNQTQHQTVHGSHTKSTKHTTRTLFNKTTCIHHSINISTTGITLRNWTLASRKFPWGENKTRLLGSATPLALLQTCSTHYDQLHQLMNQVVSTLFWHFQVGPLLTWEFLLMKVSRGVLFLLLLLLLFVYLFLGLA